MSLRKLSAHSPTIEEGRWNRRGRGRLPLEESMCSCGQVQMEAYIIMVARTDYDVVCTTVHKLVSTY